MVKRRGTSKLLRMKGSENTDDLISGLPDNLLHHIMSFLNTREAVQTCILSKRWKNVWRTLPYLYLNFNDFKLDVSNRYSPDLFMDFVSNLLLHRDPTCLHTFQLDCRYPLDSDDEIIIGWARYALMHNPRVLSLLVPNDAASQLCHSVFNCTSLEELHFGYINMLDQIKLVPETIVTPHLRHLRLYNVHLNEKFMEKMFSECPGLTDLHLVWCSLKIRSIRSRKLKCLTLHQCEYEVEMQLIDAPSLTELCIKGLEAIRYEINITSMPSLLKVVVSYSSFQPRWSVIFPRFSNVQQLELKGPSIETLLEIELPTCPIFHNLRSLFIQLHCRTCDIALTANFVRYCPKLEELVLSLDYHCQCATTLTNVFRETRISKQLRTVTLFRPKLLRKIKVLHIDCCIRAEQIVQALKHRGLWECRN
ncbi:F-box/FBD/LRR protein [Rhynchospora pubera]|uniref:F-box/FBD/LRR protein n=1 Tax=Rhynchospora pubera TaxID=906938 RepID=A0AAV8E6G1_9POAL|nr:F-box/FBD/LRR protein [Rhynchospora pubera]